MERRGEEVGLWTEKPGLEERAATPYIEIDSFCFYASI